MSYPTIAPGGTIGVLGGGQLGRMLALQGSAMGYRFITLDPTEDSPCGQVASEQIVARYDDMQAAKQLAAMSDVITYEFENVDSGVAAMLMQDSYVPQGSELLYITQHRIREKRALEKAGATVAPYAAMDCFTDQFEQAVATIGRPCVLKTATGGYDGKGQWVIRTAEDQAKAMADIQSIEDQAPTEFVLEKFIPYVKELSVIAARNPSGQVKVFPVAENIHVDNILHQSIVPARIAANVAKQAEELALQIATSLEVVGLIAVELFLTETGELYVNECAPRPHNSGHYTMEACRTSQFEQHLRTICNLPLTSTELLSPVVMVNILGEHVEPVIEWMKGEAVEDHGELTFKVHFYGKKEAKLKRKMGHINILTPDVERAILWIKQSGIWR